MVKVLRLQSSISCRHPGRSEAESRDPGGSAVRRPLGPGSPSAPGMTWNLISPPRRT
ncbi:hypothetical protein ACO2Q0_06390 [Phenylobacterium sp. VNQ135]|uniref:hypothetical protein n=1 Tax=Phenylobacterium sp. VNQ135 TaxID=3400922 RepID=UPI003C04E44C